jgi:hypothetical protein
LDQSLWWANQKYWAAVGSFYYTLFCRCKASVCLFPANYAIMLSQKPFSRAKLAFFDFSSSNCIVQDHILSSEHYWRCSNMRDQKNPRKADGRYHHTKDKREGQNKVWRRGTCKN